MAAADLNAARSKVATQQSLLKRAEAALKASEDNVHQAEAQTAARQAQLEQANARLTSAQSAPVQVAQSSSRAEGSKADAEKARAEVEQATLNLSYTRIYAPAAGHVTKKNVEPGIFVQVGQSLMAIVPPDVWITANFKETQLTHMRPGQPVTVSVDTYPGETFHGRVDSIQRGTGSRFSLLPPENATGNFVKVVQRIPVKIVFDRPEELAKYLLVPGMSVVPEVNVKADVPAAAAADSSVKKVETATR
jgi:membrane fusion protein (multidrug efflux system)